MLGTLRLICQRPSPKNQDGPETPTLASGDRVVVGACHVFVQLMGDDQFGPAGAEDSYFLARRRSPKTPRRHYKGPTMQRRIRFTRKVIENLPPCPADHSSGEIEYTSLEAPPGLKLVITKRGIKSWLLRYTPSVGARGIRRAIRSGPFRGWNRPRLSCCT